MAFFNIIINYLNHVLSKIVLNLQRFKLQQSETSLIMADIIKVKAKKSYEWSQDKKYIYVQVPLPAHTSLKKVEIFLSDLILRVTSLEKKQTHFLDLLCPVDYRSPDNKFILLDGHLHATLRKSTEEQWPSLLIEDISLAELKTRRRESELRYEQSGRQAEETKDKLRVEYDRKATQELMRFEQEERDKLDLKKQQEKEEAIRQVFAEPTPSQPLKKLEVQREEEKWRIKEQLALEMLAKEEEAERQGHSQQLKSKVQGKIIEEVTRQYQRSKPQPNQTMFSEEEVNKFEEMRQRAEGELPPEQEEEQLQEIPVRRGNNQKVGFTPRAYPNLAARDTFPNNREPPMPKSKGVKAPNGDLQSKNPLWLKDKGDSFFRDKNYVSAVQAYSEAIKADSKLTKAYLNRSLAYLKLFKLQDAINDCDQGLLLLQSELPNSEQEQTHSRLTLAKLKARKAVCLAWKGQLDASKALFAEIGELQLDAEVRQQVISCIEQIRAREQSLELKMKGDQLVKVNDLQSALSHYDQAIAVDRNEYALSNKVLCLNKLGDYRSGVSAAAEGIKTIGKFNVGSVVATKEDRDATLLLLKLHYRKAKAHEELGEIAEAEQEIRKGLTISSEDKDLKEFLGVIKRKQSKQALKQLKDSAAGLVRQGKVKEALQVYGKCLKLLEEKEDVMEYLAILQNQCVCFQKLEKFDDVLSTCIRILKLVSNIQSKVLVFGGKKEAPVDKEELRKISVRTLMRRANAYIKTAQLYNGKSDLQRAMELNQDEEVKKELQRLYEKLKQELQQ